MTSPDKPRKQRRLTPRRASKQTTRASCRKGALGLGPDLAIGLLDVSETGARLLIRNRLEAGQEVEIGLAGPGGQKPQLRIGEVIWCMEVVDGSFCVGISFQKRLEYATLHDLSRLPSM